RGLVSPTTSSRSSPLSKARITAESASSCHQYAQVRGDAARQRAQVVATLQARDDAAVRVLVGNGPDPFGDPGVVVLDQAELAELVVAVRVEAGRDEDHL